MSLTSVVGRVVSPDQTPVVYAQVTARLVGPDPAGFLAFDHATGLTASAATSCAADGSWTLPLTPQSEIIPAGSHYEIRVQAASGLTVLHIVVPVSATPVPVASLLVDVSTLDPAPLVGASYYLQRSELGAPGGPATLGPDGLVLPSQLPSSGAAGSLVLTRVAASTLGGHRLVVPTSVGTVEYADPANPAHLNLPLWMTTQAATSGAPVQVLAHGPFVEPSWSWTPGLVYLGPSGQLTQAVPASGFLAIAGSATSATAVFFDPRPPIVLT